MRSAARLVLLCALLLAGAGAIGADGNTSAPARRRLAWGAVDTDDGERLPGWQGEQSREGGALKRHSTLGSTYAREDRERGTWMELIAWRPRAYVIHNFMSAEECVALVKLAKPFMARSTVVDSVTGESKVDPIRTSEQTFLPRGNYELVTKIEERLARLTMLPWQNGEDMQILKYAPGQKYDAHHDVGELTSVSGQQLAADGGYRVATVLLYLTDVEEGGETAFPDSEWADPALAEGSWSECAEGGVAARARAGDALFFWSITPSNEIDPASMHSGCPVIKGEKWTGTKWIHAEAFRWKPPPPPPAAVGGCRDANPTCKAWALAGECTKNPGYMGDTCKRSCKLCPKTLL